MLGLSEIKHVNREKQAPQVDRLTVDGSTAAYRWEGSQAGGVLITREDGRTAYLKPLAAKDFLDSLEVKMMELAGKNALPFLGDFADSLCELHFGA